LLTVPTGLAIDLGYGANPELYAETSKNVPPTYDMFLNYEGGKKGIWSGKYYTLKEACEALKKILEDAKAKRSA
jgi:uncharacterized protein YfaP (DUF2135 family)